MEGAGRSSRVWILNMVIGMDKKDKLPLVFVWLSKSLLSGADKG